MILAALAAVGPCVPHARARSLELGLLASPTGQASGASTAVLLVAVLPPPSGRALLLPLQCPPIIFEAAGCAVSQICLGLHLMGPCSSYW